MDKLRVWGVGNVLLGDDAAGCRVAELLAASGMKGVIDCGTTPENYVATLRIDPPSALLIVDAADMGLAPGEYRLLSLSEMEAVADTSHGVPLSLLLRPFANALEIMALGIQPASMQPGAPLTRSVHEAVCHVTDLIKNNEWQTIKTPAFSAGQREGS